MAVPTEDALFQEFQEKLEKSDPPVDAPTREEALRFIRARKLDVKAAVEQFQQCVVWRKEHAPDNILDADPNEPIYRALCPHSNHKFDRTGRPIYIEKTGLISLPKLLKLLSPAQLIQRHVRQQEIAMKRMREESERRGQLVDKQLIILDLKGLSLLPNQTGINIFKETVRIDQNYYPETLGHFFIINAPWIFTPLWALLRPWLDPVTRDKFSVLGGNYRDALLQHVDAASLPEEYGGTCACDGGCVRPMEPLPE